MLLVLILGDGMAFDAVLFYRGLAITFQQVHVAATIRTSITSLWVLAKKRNAPPSSKRAQRSLETHTKLKTNTPTRNPHGAALKGFCAGRAA